ncbi:MAG: hypothetical protein AMXMBFR84_16330 [Candidatus Hydrogenedentota bacterium]
METLRLLVCDDEEGMRLGIDRALRKHVVPTPDVNGEVQFSIAQAESAEKALELIEVQPPDLLLLDLKLPGMSGLDLLDRLAPMKLDTLVIVISAYASIEAAVRATKQGAFDFLAKPFSPAELKETVAKAARHWMTLQQARKLAQERRRVRFEFISVLAHELKAPINAVEGYLNLIKSGALDSEPESRAKIVDQSVHRLAAMRKMIGDLLDMTRIESGERTRKVEVCDVGAVAIAAIETQKPAAMDHDVQITLHMPNGIQMEADLCELEMIFNNLLSNAVKYNRAGGRVDVMVDRDGEYVRIRVADTGIGMSQDECTKLFHDFVRIKNDRTRGILGSGLGLSILRKLAALYGGDIAVDSEPGIGTTFTVRLPVASIPAVANPV